MTTAWPTDEVRDSIRVPRNRRSLERRAKAALAYSTTAWVVVTAAGMWLFVGYLFLNYALPAFEAGLSAWSGTNLTTGVVPGQPLANVAIAAHIFLAITTFSLAPIQLVPAFRRRAPAAHRWSGRVFIGSAAIASVSGIYMVWARGNPQAGTLEHIGTTLNGICVLAFAAIALERARSRNFAEHRLWAMRLFMAASGTYFIRVAYGLWYFDTTQGPASVRLFSVFISYGQTIIPLGLLELYRRIQSSGNPVGKYCMAAILLLLAALTAAGTYNAYLLIWLPRL